MHLLSLISSSTQLCNLCSGILTQWHASPLSSLCIFPTLTCRKRACLGGVHTHHVCETCSPTSKFFAVCKQKPRVCSGALPRRPLARRVPSAPLLCIAVVVSIIIAEVITSPRTFCAFHPPQKAGVSFAFWFVWRFFFIIFFSSCFRNQLLGSAALSYQLEWKVTKVLVRTNCIECR